MRKKVMVCTCDSCGMEIDDFRRFAVQLGIGSWNEDDSDVSVKIEKDLCISCYEALCDLIEDRPSEVIKTKKVVTKFDAETLKKIKEMYIDNCSYKEMMDDLDLTYNQAFWQCHNLRKKGVQKKPLKKELIGPIMVDKEGFLV